MSPADRIASHLASLTFDDLPAETVQAAKRLILDTLGVAWAGAREPGCREVLDVARAEAGNGGAASVWSADDALPPSSAAMVNGAFAAALDFDSLHIESIVHPEVVTLPAAMAIAEREHRSGRELIAAVVAGSDLTCRIGFATPRDGEWFVTSTAGALAAAASAGKMLRLGPEQMRNALGLALCQSSGTVQAVIQQTLAKRLQSAFAARNGVEAAMLAAAGIDGPRDVFTGPGGYFAVFGGGDANVLLDGLGRHFETGATGIKKFPSCACNHATIEATRQLMEVHAIGPDDVKRVSLHLSPFMIKIVGAAFDPAGAPQVTGQFSAAYSVACTLLRGGVGLQDLTAEAVRDPAIAALVERVAIVEDPDNRGLLVPITVEIETATTTHRCTVSVVPGSEAAPLSDDELVAKFTDCIGYGEGRPLPERAEALAGRLFALEDVDDVAGLFSGRPG